MTFEQKLVCAMAAFAVASQPGTERRLKWLQAYKHATGAYCDGNAREAHKGFGYMKSLVRGAHDLNLELLAYTIVSRACPSKEHSRRRFIGHI